MGIHRGFVVTTLALLGAIVIAGCSAGVGSDPSSGLAPGPTPPARPGAYVWVVGAPDLVLGSVDGGATWKVSHRSDTNIFTGDLAIGAHNLESHTLKVALTNTAPDPANDAVWSAGAFPPPVAANGYTTGGNTLVTSAGGSTPGVYKLTLVDSVFTAQT